MGSFRSQPDLVKHSAMKQVTGYTYAVTHMCGIDNLIQDGGSTWKMRILLRPSSKIRKTLYLESLTATVVFIFLKSGAEVSTFVERHFIDELESNPNYLKSNYELALRETFMKMDVILASNVGKEEITKIQR
jgi:hypothetical protein